MELKGKRLVLGVTGGIAAYKAAELVRLLVREGAEVQVAMSEGATHFVTPTTFQALSGRPVYLDQWDARMPNAMAHIDLSRQADLLLWRRRPLIFWRASVPAWPMICWQPWCWRAIVRCWWRRP